MHAAVRAGHVTSTRAWSVRSFHRDWMRDYAPSCGTVGRDSEAEAEPSEAAVPEDDAGAPRRLRHRSGDRGLHQLGDLLLHHGAQGSGVFRTYGGLSAMHDCGAESHSCEHGHAT